MICDPAKLTRPRITFGIIVLNGEPFIRYNIRTLYHFAHEIIVVEGASQSAAAIAGKDGHSWDDTLLILKHIKDYEDPENKIYIITAEDEGYSNGFWPGEKDEQSQAYARRATGDYLWQIDIDEFYRADDIKKIISFLQVDPSITAISFPMITFWGSFDYITNGWYLIQGAGIYHRLFKWGQGYRYITHRPPTVLDPDGRDLRKIQWLQADQLKKYGIRLYHYSLLFPKQVTEKMSYYSNKNWGNYSKGAQIWANEIFLALIQKPFQVHNVHLYVSWLEKFKGKHPEQIYNLKKDIEKKGITIELRHNQDVKNILDLKSYFILRIIAKLLSHIKCLRLPYMHILSKPFFKIHYEYKQNRLTLFNRRTNPN